MQIHDCSLYSRLSVTPLRQVVVMLSKMENSDAVIKGYFKYLYADQLVTMYGDKSDLVNSLRELIDESLKNKSDITLLMTIAKELSGYCWFPFDKAILPHGSDEDYANMIREMEEFCMHDLDNWYVRIKDALHTALELSRTHLQRLVNVMKEDDVKGTVTEFLLMGSDKLVIEELLTICDIDDEIEYVREIYRDNDPEELINKLNKLRIIQTD